MGSGEKIIRFLPWLGVAVLQLFMTQVVTFLFSLLVPNMENFPQAYPVLFVIFLGITFSIGVFLAGWLVLRLGWLVAAPKYPARFVAALVGAYVPLIVALVIYGTLEAGNPFFIISIVLSILGFNIPGWLERK